MNKKIKKLLIFFFFQLFLLNASNASMLWDIGYGIKKYRSSEFKEAAKYLFEYTISNPNDKDGYYWLAKTLYALKDTKGANENFKKAYEFNAKEKNIEKIDFNIDTTSDIEDYFDMAAMYFETGDLKQSEAYADMMLKINPKSPSAYFIKAKIAQILNDEEKAKEYINKAIIFNNKLIKTNLAKSLNINKLPEMTLDMYEVFALEAYFSSDITSAIKYCKKYLDINPNSSDMSNLLIDLYIKNNELSLAQELIDKVLNTSANISTILYQAKIYEIKNDQRLENTLLSAYKINPNNPCVLLELGNYYLKNKDFNSAKKYFEILINVDDEFYEAYFGYVYSSLKTGISDQMINYIRKMISLNEKSSESEFLLAEICLQNAEFEEALQYLNSAINKAKNPKYYLEAAKINYDLKNYQESLANLNMISKLPESGKYQDEAEDLYIKNCLKIKDTVNANMYLNKKISLDKKRLMYKYNLYVIYKLQGNEKIAATQLEEVRKTKPATVQDYVDLSEIFYEEEKFDEAIKILDKGIKNFRKEFLLYSQKAKIYTLSGKKERAKETLGEFNKISNN